jgi:Fe-S oxidoreductase
VGEDYQRFGFQVKVVHSSVFVAELLRGAGTIEPPWDEGEVVTYHDPCYLGRYAGTVDEPRELLTTLGAEVKEPVRSCDNPYCCGAGGGLLFADKEEEPGSRISDVRLAQLRETGAGTVVTACPFCSIMLKGAQASVQADTKVIDLMTFVQGRFAKRQGRLTAPGMSASDGRAEG